MASVLLRRHIARSAPRAAIHNYASSSKRALQTSAILRQAEPLNTDSEHTTDAKTLMDYHTVEDLQAMTAADVLAETGTRKNAQMRHFTGVYCLEACFS